MADMSPLGSRNQPVLVLVTADQTSIVGDGSPNNPLRTADDSSDDFVTSLTGLSPALGQAVRSATPTTVAGASASSGANARAVGLVIELLGGSAVRVRTRGIIELTSAQWNAIAGTSAGLVPGTPYYVASAVGHITEDIEGASTAQVGVALSPTELLLSCPSVPRAF